MKAATIVATIVPGGGGDFHRGQFSRGKIVGGGGEIFAGGAFIGGIFVGGKFPDTVKPFFVKLTFFFSFCMLFLQKHEIKLFLMDNFYIN